MLSPETSTLYLVGLAQFIILALVFNKGYPHRCGRRCSVLRARCAWGPVGVWGPAGIGGLLAFGGAGERVRATGVSAGGWFGRL